MAKHLTQRGEVTIAGLASNEVILKQNSKYLIRFTSGTADNLCNLLLEWYEHTNSV